MINIYKLSGYPFNIRGDAEKSNGARALKYQPYPTILQPHQQPRCVKCLKILLKTLLEVSKSKIFFKFLKLIDLTPFEKSKDFKRSITCTISTVVRIILLIFMIFLFVTIETNLLIFSTVGRTF